MKTNRNSKIKKNKSSFWDILPQINNKEKSVNCNNNLNTFV